MLEDGFEPSGGYELPAFFLRLREFGVGDAGILKVFERTDLQHYIPGVPNREVWLDRDHDIGFGQNSSSLSIHAIMVHALELTKQDKVLQVGVGSGYQTALLARLSRRVYGIDRVRPLVQIADRRLVADNIRNATLIAGDGSEGWTSQAPFDAIILNAACDQIPTALWDQVRVGGRIVAPLVTDAAEESLVKMVREETTYTSHVIGFGSFPPLIPGRVVEH